MIFCALAFIAAAAPATLTYASTSTPPTPASTTLTRIEAGQQQCVAVDGANLREKADVKSAVVSTLELGAAATIRGIGPAVVLTGRVDRWLEVDVDGHHGFVFGNVLSPVCGRADFDGDGDDEIWAASFTSEFNVRVRVRDPSQKDSTKQTASTDIDLESLRSSSSAIRGGTVKAIAVASPDKRALLGLDICAGADCRAAVVAWATDPTADGRGAAAVLLTGAGNARLPKLTGTTLRLGTQTARLGTWPWVTCPACGAQPVPVRAVPRVDALQGGIGDGEDDLDSAACARFAVVREGRYGGADVLDCFVSRFGKGAPGEEEPTPRLFFVRVGKQLVPAGTEDASADDVVDFASVAKRHGLTIGGEPVDLRGIAHGAIRDDLQPSTSISMKDRDGVVLFAHRDVGPVVELQRGPLFTETPAGRELWRFDVKDVPAGYTVSHDEGCGAGDDAVVLAAADLDPTRTKLSAAGLKRRLEILGAFDKDIIASTPTTASIFAKQPPLVVTDTFGRAIEAVPLAFRRGCLAEPIVYAYAPTPTILTIDVAIPTYTTSPPLPRGGWRVRTRADGELDLLGADDDDDDVRRVPRLFWEASTPRFEAPAEGYVVDRGDLATQLRDLGAQLGLTPREAGELADAWDRRIAGDVAAVFVGVHDRALLERLAPLTITPPPDVVHRVLLDLRPIDADEAATLRTTTSPPTLPTPPTRHGVVVVEWGAQLRD